MKIQAISDNISGYQLLEALPAAIYTCDAMGFIQVFNAAAVELWGRKPRPGVDKWCGSWKIFRPDGTPLPHDECPMARALQEGIVIEGEEIMVEKPNGERRHIRPYPRPVFDDLGNVSGAVNMLIDITSSKRMEKDMAHFAAIVQSSEDAIISKTLEGVITSWNPAAEKMFGYSAEEMIGQPIIRLIPPDRLNEEVYIINRISSGERVEHFTTLRQTKDLRLIDISLTISPIKDSRGRIIGASKIARDITKSKIEEQRLIQSERSLNELANAMPQLVWINDAAGNTIYFNDRFEEYGAQPVDGPGWRTL
ncbi:MAG TPA: PAS domain S-box protein, partial [Chitinophagaceae bacterium]|nr:PAS domain S-box protein [Chitinophagaceae bacterium]